MFCGVQIQTETSLLQNSPAPFLTRELRACARASYRYDVGNGICSLARSLARSLDWSIPVNFFQILGF